MQSVVPAWKKAEQQQQPPMVDPSFGGGSHLYDRSTRGGRATSATAATSATQQQRQHKINVIRSHLDLDRDPQPTRDRWGTEMPPKKEPCQSGTSSLGTFFDRFKQDKGLKLRKKEKQGVPPPATSGRRGSPPGSGAGPAARKAQTIAARDALQVGERGVRMPPMFAEVPNCER